MHIKWMRKLTRLSIINHFLASGIALHISYVILIPFLTIVIMLVNPYFLLFFLVLLTMAMIFKKCSFLLLFLVILSLVLHVKFRKRVVSNAYFLINLFIGVEKIAFRSILLLLLSFVLTISLLVLALWEVI